MTSDAKARVKKNAWLAMNTLQYAPPRLAGVYFRGQFPEEIREGLFWATLRIDTVVWNVKAMESGDEEEITQRGGWMNSAAAALDLIEGIRAMLRGYVSPLHKWDPGTGRKELAEALRAIDEAYKPIRRFYDIIQRNHPPRDPGPVG